jgi:phosphoglycerol transferase MdoB-like AlkP superfamily enzyme
LTAAHHTDMVLGRFIDKLKRSSAWADTVVFIMCDHLMRLFDHEPSGAFRDRRMLMFAIGGPISPRVVRDAGKDYDAAPTLTDLLGVKHNYVFPIGESLLGNPSASRIRGDDGDARMTALCAYVQGISNGGRL